MCPPADSRLRHQRIKEIFFEVYTLSVRARRRFLDATCANDLETRAEVESLLAHHDAAALGSKHDLAGSPPTPSSPTTPSTPTTPPSTPTSESRKAIRRKR